MPFKTIRDEALGLVIHEGHGQIVFEDIRNQLVMCYGETGWTHHSLWDLRDASLTQLSTGQVLALADVAKSFAKGKQGKKNAWVAVNPLDFGFCRMSEMSAENMGLGLGVFSDFDEALSWITA